MYNPKFDTHISQIETNIAKRNIDIRNSRIASTSIEQQTPQRKPTLLPASQGQGSFVETNQSIEYNPNMTMQASAN